jgi:hypothetical protein
VWLGVDILERRSLLSAVSCTGTGDGKSWTDPHNWSNQTVPGTSDDVTLNATGSPTIRIDSGTQSIHSLTSVDPLAINGGSLTVAAASALSGGLALAGGSLTANGAGVTLAVPGTTTHSGGSLEALGGATLTLNELTGFTGAVNGTDTLEASGPGSVLTVDTLVTLTEDATKVLLTDPDRIARWWRRPFAGLDEDQRRARCRPERWSEQPARRVRPDDLSGRRRQGQLLQPPGPPLRHHSRWRPHQPRLRQPHARRHRRLQPDRVIHRRHDFGQ